MNQLPASLITYKRFELDSSLLGKFTSNEDIMDFLLVKYQSGSIIFPTYNAPVTLLLKFIHSTRFSCDEIVLESEDGVLFSIYSNYQSPVIQTKNVDQIFNNLSLNISEDSPVVPEFLIDCNNSFSISSLYEYLFNYFKEVKKVNNLVLFGSQNTLMVLILGFYSYYFCDSLYYQKDENSQKVRIF